MRATISLTPLIDVVFILVIFFMLASQLVQWREIGVDAARPGTGTTSTPPLIVELRSDGAYLAGGRVPMAALGSRTATARASDPARAIVLRVGEGVTLQTTVSALDALAAAGISDATLLASEAP